MSERVWCHYPKVARFLTEDVPANETNIASDFLREELDSSLVNANSKPSGHHSKQKAVKDAKSGLIWDSDEDSDTDSASLYKQHTKYERRTSERSHKKEKSAKLKNAKNYRH